MTTSTPTTISPLASAMQAVKIRMNGLPSTSPADDAVYAIDGRLTGYKEKLGKIDVELREVDALMSELDALRRLRLSERFALANTINTLTETRAKLETVSV